MQNEMQRGIQNRFKMRHPALALTLIAALMSIGGHASAINLQEAYAMALQNDPVYRSAYYDQQVGKESAIIGRSALLPSLQGNYNFSKNRTDITATNALGRESLTHPNYVSRVAAVQLRQPLFNLDALARYKQGKAQSALSEEMFNVRTQELLLRVVSGYVDALYAEEQVAMVIAQREAYAEQQKLNQRLLTHGEGTRTDVLEITARLELAEAQLIEAKDNLLTARNTLAGIIGGEVGTLRPLDDKFSMQPLTPGGLEYWRSTALTSNPELKAQTIALEVARQEINKARAGHAPRLDFVATYSKNDAETINTFNQDSVIRSVGVQLVVPLYQGGYVNAISRQAVANLEKTRADLQAKTDKALIEVTKQYSAVQSGVAKVNALNRAVESGNLLIQATEQSIKGGVRINLDLLNAQQQLFATKRDLAQARYAFLLAKLRLSAAAGTLSAADMNQTAAYFR